MKYKTHRIQYKNCFNSPYYFYIIIIITTTFKGLNAM